MKYYCLTALLLLALTSSQGGISLPGPEEIARVTIEDAPLHLYTTDYLLEALPCFTPAEGGHAETPKAGRRYYRRLLMLPYKKGEMQEEFRLRALTNCLTAYTPEESTEGLLGRIDQALARLRPLARNDWAAGTEMRNVEDMRNVILHRVGGAGAMKREIMLTADPAKRLDALVNIYLDVDMRYYEFVADWALHEIVRAGRAGDAAEVIAAFRRAITRLPRDEAREARRARALHAVEYFGGKLTPAERDQRRPFESRYDPLSFEEF